MSKSTCRFCGRLSQDQRDDALRLTECHRCSVTQAELIIKGQSLEVCGEEFLWDPATNARVIAAITLCPDCHAKEHLDARSIHDPCHIKARRAREQLF